MLFVCRMRVESGQNFRIFRNLRWNKTSFSSCLCTAIDEDQQLFQKEGRSHYSFFSYLTLKFNSFQKEGRSHYAFLIWPWNSRRTKTSQLPVDISCWSATYVLISTWHGQALNSLLPWVYSSMCPTGSAMRPVFKSWSPTARNAWNCYRLRFNNYIINSYSYFTSKNHLLRISVGDFRGLTTSLWALYCTVPFYCFYCMVFFIL